MTGVTAIIVTFNNRDLVLAQLERILKSGGEGLHIILVDNASSDGTAEAVMSRWSGDDRLTLICQKENRGGAGGFRRGMEEALKGSSDLFWLLDDDAIPRDDALEELLHAAKSINGPWGALGSLIAQEENPDLITETGGGLLWLKGKLTALNQNQPIQSMSREPFIVGHAAAASLLIRREAVERCGFFEDIFIHFDDVEWCYRIARRGFPIYSVPRSVVHHPFKKGSTPGWIRYYDARNILLVYARHRPLLLPVPLMRYLLMALVFLFRGEGKTARFILMGQCDFLRRKIRLRKELV
ncbi:MAG: glycosyltransferase family 2 protein [Spirochaetales bacterium]|nr:glycosyltransferase family 2 protein [Spirochaetales bacterium]